MLVSNKLKYKLRVHTCFLKKFYMAFQGQMFNHLGHVHRTNSRYKDVVYTHLNRKPTSHQKTDIYDKKTCLCPQP